MVGDTGIEPVAFPMSRGRSPAELIAHRNEGRSSTSLPLTWQERPGGQKRDAPPASRY
jgi:hypothetical protein